MNKKYSDQDYANWSEAYASGLSSYDVANLFQVKDPTLKLLKPGKPLIGGFGGWNV